LRVLVRRRTADGGMSRPGHGQAGHLNRVKRSIIITRQIILVEATSCGIRYRREMMNDE
jgi:hypothetical protein